MDFGQGGLAAPGLQIAVVDEAEEAVSARRGGQPVLVCAVAQAGDQGGGHGRDLIDADPAAEAALPALGTADGLAPGGGFALGQGA